MRKTLITHINPHLDDIAAIWLFKKYHLDFKEASIEFVSQSVGNLSAEESEDKIYLGVGRGKFDEHKGDVNDCATSLVWRFFREESLLPKDEAILKAIEEIVEWVRLGDIGRLPRQEYDDFSVPAFIRPSDNSNSGSLKAVELGCEILDRILKVVTKKQRSLIDWGKKKKFQTKFGVSIAIESEFVDRAFCKSTGEADLYLMVDPNSKHVQYFTPSYEIDLEPIYNKVKSLDPSASWFLHHSHHMVICGSSSAPDSKPTKLTMNELIEAAKSA